MDQFSLLNYHCTFSAWEDGGRISNILIKCYCIIDWITMTRKSGKYCMWHTEQLESWFDLIRSHKKKKRVIGLMSREFDIGPGHRGSIPGRVMPKT